jgi:hypothetical protein
MLIRMASVAVLSLTLLSAGTFAGTASNALIVTLGIDDGAPNILFIRVDRAKDAGTEPSCHTNGSWNYVRPLVSEQDKKVYAMLLAAKSTQTPVTLIGTTNCAAYSGIETLQAVYY